MREIQHNERCESCRRLLPSSLDECMEMVYHIQMDEMVYGMSYYCADCHRPYDAGSMIISYPGSGHGEL